MWKKLKQSELHYNIKKKTILKILLAFTLLIALTITYSFYIEPHWIQLKNINIADKDIPNSFEDIKIVFLSDIHYYSGFSEDRLKNLVKMVNKLNPDIIILGGDYVLGSSKYIEPCFEELRNLKAPLGVFGVLGNHDHWEDAELTRQCMKKARIILIDNQSKWIYKNRKRIKIGGVGDLWEDQQHIEPTIKDVEEKNFAILISHNPDYVEEITTDKIDLVLSGHIHGGHITLFGLWAPISISKYGQKYRTGIVKTKHATVIISNGVGNTIPIRFCARPDIYLIHLKNK